MKFFSKTLIIFIFCLSLSLEQSSGDEEDEYISSNDMTVEDDEFESPCEYINENENFTIKSYEDCKDRSSEYIYEICCFLRGKESKNNDTRNECVDINRDDKILDKGLNATKKKIMDGTYWNSWNGTYDSIEILDCHLGFIFMKKISILLLFLLY